MKGNSLVAKLMAPVVGLFGFGAAANNAEAAVTITPTTVKTINDGLVGITVGADETIYVSSDDSTYDNSSGSYTLNGEHASGVNDTAGLNATHQLFANDDSIRNINLTNGSNSSYTAGSMDPWGVATSSNGNYTTIGSGNNIFIYQNTPSGPQMAAQVGLPSELAADIGTTFTGLGMDLAEGGDPSIPAHYFVGVTGDNNEFSTFMLNPNALHYHNFLVSGTFGENSDLAFHNGHGYLTTNIANVAGQIVEFDMTSMGMSIPEPNYSIFAPLALGALASRRRRVD